MSDGSIIVIGGGPAGLRAAEVASAAGLRVELCDAQSSVGRKFLVAGKGGLNLTHSEPAEKFPERYGRETERWRDLLAEFSPADLQAWVEGLGIETYVGSSGRVFPRGQKAAALLMAWTARLRAAGVRFHFGARLRFLEKIDDGWQVGVQTAVDELRLDADAVVLACGGASWPETGSDGRWTDLLAELGVEITPWVPANCGWDVDWPGEFLTSAEGLPLKNLTVTAGTESVSGELLITRYGLEGGAIYRLGPILRAMSEPAVTLDLKPQLTVDALQERLAQTREPSEWARVIKLSPAGTLLVQTRPDGMPTEAGQFIALVKNFSLRLRGPRPIAEAISSAGGVAWRELDHALMLRKLPGVFLAGEMIDWEAPTGGYLMQGCFATGTRAARGAIAFAQKVR
ncbi:MAG: TIGR03862 family flavoprotein [Chthoniobacterales bacterium]